LGVAASRIKAFNGSSPREPASGSISESLGNRSVNPGTEDIMRLKRARVNGLFSRFPQNY
jgi:hypothetical protein